MEVLFFQFAAACTQSNFFGLPTWYHYLIQSGRMQVSAITGQCEIVNDFQLADLSLVALAILDILLRIAGMVAVGYVIYGGILFVVSQGESDKSKQARQTIINALIGLGIAMVAVGAVSFLGARLGN